MLLQVSHVHTTLNLWAHLATFKLTGQDQVHNHVPDTTDTDPEDSSLSLVDAYLHSVFGPKRATRVPPSSPIVSAAPPHQGDAQLEQGGFTAVYFSHALPRLDTLMTHMLRLAALFNQPSSFLSSLLAAPSQLAHRYPLLAPHCQMPLSMWVTHALMHHGAQTGDIAAIAQLLRSINQAGLQATRKTWVLALHAHLNSGKLVAALAIYKHLLEMYGAQDLAAISGSSSTASLATASASSSSAAVGPVSELHQSYEDDQALGSLLHAFEALPNTEVKHSLSVSTLLVLKALVQHYQVDAALALFARYRGIRFDVPPLAASTRLVYETSSVHECLQGWGYASL